MCIRDRIQAAHDRLATLKAQRDALLYESPSADLEPYFEAVLEEWQNYTIAEKKKIATAAIERVLVDDNAIHIILRAAYGS